MSAQKNDEFSRLEAKLAKLRQRERGPGEARFVRGQKERLLAAVVSEVDETILPREIGFSSENGARFHVAVANRRLQALVSCETADPAFDAVVGAKLTSVEDPYLGALKDALLTAFGESDTWTVSSRRQSEGPYPSDIGVPSDQLARAWDVSSSGTGANPKEPLTAFLDGLETANLAWLAIEGEEVTKKGGDENVVAKLSENAAIFLDSYFSKQDALFQGEAGPHALVFLPTAVDGAVLFIDCGDAMAFVNAETKVAVTLTNDWQAATAI